MTHAQYSDVVQALGSVRAAVMTKEMSDDGWDLRGELLALQEAVSLLARLAYEACPETVQLRGESKAAVRRFMEFDPNIYEDEDN